jgi:hypothetical protein
MVKKQKPTKKPAEKDKVKDVGGRPTLLTDKVIAKIVEALSYGASYDLASRWAGISYPTLQNWQRIARAAKLKAEAEGENALDATETAYLMFLRQIEEVEAKKGLEWQKTLDVASKKDPDQALAALRRRFDGYSERTQVQLTANIDLSKFSWTPEQLSYIIQYGLTNEQIFRLNAGENPATVLPVAGASPAVANAKSGK